MRPCTSRSRRFLALALMLATAGLGACRAGAYTDGVSSRAPAPGSAFVTVKNQNPRRISVYLLRGSTPVRLGSVDTLEMRTFTVPASMIGPMGAVRLTAEPLGSRTTYASDVIQAGAGDWIEWTLAPSLKLSTVIVRTAPSPAGLR